MNNHKLLLIFGPFIILALDLVIAWSHFGSNPKMILSLFLLFWMVTWWIFEIVPMGVTALIPLFFLPLYQIVPIKDVSPHYANPVIFLFLGGFIIARALEKTKLDERIALSILRVTGSSDNGIIIGFIIATTFLSMWISNTATTVMMLPIAMSVIQFLQDNLDEKNKKGIPALAAVLYLSLAYSASIGGIMTPIGTPPNVVYLGYLSDLYQRKIDFWRWLVAMAPMSILLLIAMFYILKKLNPFQIELPATFKSFINDKVKSLGPINIQQKITIAVFLLAGSLWIFKDFIHLLVGTEFLNDTSIAIFCGVLLFLIPTNINTANPILDRSDIPRIPWDIVLLFGGGLALAGCLETVGIIELATQSFGRFQFGSSYIFVGILVVVTLILTEVMSNVALCVVALPLIMKLGEAQGVDPLLVSLPCAICASFGFMMPISTPPNAIVFGSNAITMKQMMRGGLLLDIAGVALIMTVGYAMIQWILL